MPAGRPERNARLSTWAAPYQPEPENTPPELSVAGIRFSITLPGKFFCLFILILLIMLQGAGRASGQAPGLVRVAPESTAVEVGAEVTLSLEVIGAEDVNAYDLILRYDPAFVTLVSWSHGGYLSNLAQVLKVEEPGTLRLVFTQLATPPVSGDGVLLNLVFSGAAVGQSAVSIENLEFAGSSGGIVSPGIQDGWLAVLPASTAAAPPTETPLPPAEIRTPTPWPTSTGVAEYRTAPASPPPGRTPRATANAERSQSSPADAAVTTPSEIAAAPPGEEATPSEKNPPDLFLPAVESGQAAAAEEKPARGYQLVNTLLWILLWILVLAAFWMAANLVRRRKIKKGVIAPEFQTTKDMEKRDITTSNSRK